MLFFILSVRQLLTALGVWLMRISRLIFATLLVIAVSTTFVFVKGSARGPRLQISNDSTQDVSVTAIRRDRSRDLGTVEAGSRIFFTVRDEGSMVFEVRYADGREIESTPIYFASGTTTNVRISQDGVDIRRDTDT